MSRQRLSFEPGAMAVRRVLLALIVAAYGGGFACREATTPPAFRHVLLISVDTLRADFLACYGHPYVASPHVDRLAREGILFEQHISVAPTTLASHTSLMTGTYPRTHGTPRNGFEVGDHNVMLAEVLRRAGFQTAAFIAGLPLASVFNFQQGFDHFDEPSRWNGHRNASRVTDLALAWLEEPHPGRTFVFVHYYDVHGPYVFGEPYDSMYRDDDLDITGSTSDTNRLVGALRLGDPDALEMSRAMKRAYAGGVTYTDSQIGRLVDGVRDLGLLDETLLILTSDHGEAMDAHAEEYWEHGRTVFDGSVQIPLILRFPGSWRGGERIGQLIANVDVAPTLIELLGLSPAGSVEGRSFVPLLTGSERPIRDAVFIEATRPSGKRHERGTVWRNERKMRSVRTARWKLLHEPLERRTRLYDLSTDPSEQNDLASESAAHTEVADLKSRLDAWAAGPATPETRAILDEQTRSQLRALGYAE